MRFFSGIIDEVKVYSGARSQDQIAYDFNRGRPIGWWKLEDCTGATANDSSDYNHDGTITIGGGGTNTTTGTCSSGTGTEAWNNGTNGKYNSSLDFDGTDDYIDMGDVAKYDFGASQDFSISGWFYRDTATTDDVIIADRNSLSTDTDDGWIVYLDATTDQLIFEASETGGTDEYSLASTSTFTSTGWNHFAIIWDDDTAGSTTLYINGKEDNPTKTGTLTNIGALTNSVNFRIGSESDSGSPFIGQIDEVRIYNYAISAAQARKDMNNDTGNRFGPSSGLP
jgi:hypothetical protein